MKRKVRMVRCSEVLSSTLFVMLNFVDDRGSWEQPERVEEEDLVVEVSHMVAKMDR